MKKSLLLLIATTVFLCIPCYADNAKQIYKSTSLLEGDWILSPVSQQQGTATKHKLVAPLIGTDVITMNFKLIDKGGTVQEPLLPGNKKEMVSMYHSRDAVCTEVKVTHYCAKKINLK